MSKYTREWNIWKNKKEEDKRKSNITVNLSAKEKDYIYEVKKKYGLSTADLILKAIKNLEGDE